MHLDDPTDHALVDQALGGDVARIPGERPVDRHADAGLGERGGDHAVGIGEGGREGLLDEDVDAIGRDQLDIVGVGGGRRAEDDQVGLRRPDAAVDVGEDAVVGDLEVGARRRHALDLDVTDADDLGMQVFVDLSQEIAHVRMIEIDAGDAPGPHSILP